METVPNNNSSTQTQKQRRRFGVKEIIAIIVLIATICSVAYIAVSTSKSVVGPYYENFLGLLLFRPIGGPYYKNFFGVIYDRRDYFSGSWLSFFAETYYKKIEGVNSRKFKFLGDVYATDGSHVFCWQVAPEIDAASFQMLPNGYAKDKNNVFLNCNILLKQENSSSSPISFDAQSAQLLNCNTVKDKTGVYLNPIINDAPTGSNYRTAGYATIRDNLILGSVDFSYYILNKIDKADPETYKITNPDPENCTAQDKNYSYIYDFKSLNDKFKIYNITFENERVAKTLNSWLLYSNKDSRIKLYYPPHLKTEIDITPLPKPNSGSDRINIWFMEPGKQYNEAPITFSTNPYKTETDLQTYILSYLGMNTQIKDVTIGNKKAKQVFTDYYTYTYFMRDSDNGFFEFILRDDLPVYKTIYDKMLERFEFY